MSAPVTIRLNGEEIAVADGATVADLVAEHAESPRGLAVAVNAEVVPRSAWSVTALAGGDRVELLVAAQGG